MYSIHQDNRRYRTSPYLEKEGSVSGFTPQTGGGLLLTSENGVGYYFLKGFDTGEDEMSFNRLKLADNFTRGMKLTTYVLIQDSPYGEYNNNIVEIDEVLQDNDIPQIKKLSPKDKLEFLLQQGAKIYSNHTDILLHGLVGRYIWIAIRSYNTEDKCYSLSGIQIEYPMLTFVDYLPQVYSEGGEFFQRYMGIFQSLYLDVEKTIDKLPLYLDVDTVPDSFLSYLGKWVGIDNSSDIFNPSQMRKVIKRATIINGGKGTKATLEELITLYTGTKPIIIEYFYWENTIGTELERKKLYQRLYGEDRCFFTVIIDMKQASKGIVRDKLKHLIEQYKPAMSKYHLVLLENCDHSDIHCYLGINSYLAKPDKMQIDTGMALTGETML